VLRPSRPHSGDVQRHPRLPWRARRASFEAATEQDRLAGSGVGCHWEKRRHHQRGPGPPFSPAFPAKVDPVIVDFFRPSAEAALDMVDESLQGPTVAGGATAARSPTSAAGAAWCSWPRAACRSTRGPTSGRGATRLMAMPGFRAALRPHSQEGCRAAGLRPQSAENIGNPVAGGAWPRIPPVRTVRSCWRHWRGVTAISR